MAKAGLTKLKKEKNNKLCNNVDVMLILHFEAEGTKEK